MAIAKWYNNASEGTWLIKGTFGDSRLIRDSGNYLRAVSGEGTIVVAFNRDGTSVYANGALQYSTAPPLTSVTGGGIVVCEEGLSEIANVQFIPRMYDNAEAIANATSDVAITLEWIFVDDSSIVAKFDEQEYGVRSLTDGGDVIRSQNLKDAFTFTRSSTGTYVGADGLIKTAAVDEPRYDHDPITGEPKGVLIEESRTNLLLWSEDFTNVVWGKTGVTATPDTAAAPDGAVTADTLVEGTNTGTHFIIQSTGSNTAGQYSAKVYLKAAGRHRGKLAGVHVGSSPSSSNVYFDLVNETVTFDGGASGAELVSLPDGWFQVSIYYSFDVDVSNHRLALNIYDDAGVESYTGDGTSGIYVWGGQLEQI